jgi:hypothetical protein
MPDPADRRRKSGQCAALKACCPKCNSGSPLRQLAQKITKIPLPRRQNDIEAGTPIEISATRQIIDMRVQRF